MEIHHKCKIKIASCNIWFSNHEREKRAKIICDLVMNNNIDIVCMQEVMNEPYEKIKKVLGYYYPNKIAGVYGCAIISKYPILQSKIINLPSNMGRKLVLVKINVNGKIIIVCTTHFESEFDKCNIIKQLQFGYVSAIIQKIYCDYKNVIFCADTNVTNDDKKLFSREFDDLVDCWKIHKNNKLKYTYDCKTNKYLKDSKYLARLDRILCRGDNITCNDFYLIGVTDDEQFSDHYGVLCEFDLLVSDLAK